MASYFHGKVKKTFLIQSVKKINASKPCVAKNDMQTISYSNKMNINFFLFMKNKYVEINFP